MTFADTMDEAFQNGWVNPSDLYTSFDIDIGFTDYPIGGSVEAYKVCPPLKHHEIVPYKRTSKETLFIIRNTENEQTIYPRVSCHIGTGFISGLYATSSITGDHPASSDLTISWLSGKDSYANAPGLYTLSPSEILHTDFSPTSLSEVPSVLDYQHLGVYFLATEIVPDGTLYTYDADSEDWNTNSEKYTNGYVIVLPYFVTLGEIEKDLIAESAEQYSANPDIYKGYFSTNSKIVIPKNDGTGTSIEFPQKYYREKEGTIIYPNAIAGGGWNLITTTEPTYNFCLAIPFASETERDFALGMTENLKYLSKEEYEELNNG